MPQTPYLSAPVKTAGMPPGVPYIIGNEAAERFSYYGMRAILVVFMTQYLLGRNGQPDPMARPEAMAHYHDFLSAVYFFPLLGSIISDAFLGKYRTVIYLSIVYCLGHLVLAVDATRAGLAIGLTLVAIGSGGIKPCVSAIVGDQFGASNQHLLARVFGWFYFSINTGSAVSVLLIPKLLDSYGSHVAFAIPGILMLVATIVFWLGRRKFVHIPSAGMAFVREVFSWNGFKVVSKLVPIYALVAVFWCLYDQTSSAWVLQAKQMDLHWLGRDWLPAQVHSLNPILILVFIPLFSYVVFPAINKVFPLTPLRKIGLGFVLAAASFLVPALVEIKIAAGLKPHLTWHLLAYMIITAGEVCVSITCLEFSYTQAPPRMKSLIMALYYFSISMGNELTATVNRFLTNADGSTKLSGASYYLFFAGLMGATVLLFTVLAMKYKERTYIQDEAA